MSQSYMSPVTNIYMYHGNIQPFQCGPIVTHYCNNGVMEINHLSFVDCSANLLVHFNDIKYNYFIFMCQLIFVQ